MKKKIFNRFVSALLILAFVLSFVSVDARAESGEYTIVVNVTQNVVTVYQNGQPIKAMTCSTGTYTPRSGTYRTSDKYVWHYLVGGVCGQYCTRITGQILFHSVPYTRLGDNTSLEYWEYDKLGTSASLGCVRLCVEDAKWIYDNCARATAVTFVTDNTMPLGKPATYKISSMPEPLRYWDPTDPADGNPWRIYANPSCFDARYYADNYPDLKAAFGYDEASLLTHWICYGINEERRASKEFDLHYYKSNYEDLKAAYGNDNLAYIIHYICYGKNEGRKAAENVINDSEINELIYDGLSYDAVFDYDYYIANNKDVYNAYGDNKRAVFEHFIVFGMNEGRSAKADFNVWYYRQSYGDLQAAFGNDLRSYYLHYIIYGKNEGRYAGGTATVNSNPAPQPTSTAPVTVKDGIDYSDVYDYDFYVANNPDVYQAYGDNKEAVLEHFIIFGMNEGRMAKKTFNVSVYKSLYEDLRMAYGNDTKSYYIHYIIYGKNEGRQCY